MKRPDVRLIPRKEAKALLQRQDCKLDSYLTEKFHSEVYQLPDGTVLCQSASGKWAIWQRDDLVDVVEVTEAMRHKHPLADLIPDGASFPSAVSRLITELATKLNLPRDQLDFTNKSVQRVERAVLRQIRHWGCLGADLFPGLTAYIGELIRHRRGGEWEMRRGYDGKTWEPWIRLPNGKEYSPTATLLRTREGGIRGTLYTCVWGDLRDTLDMQQKQ